MKKTLITFTLAVFCGGILLAQPQLQTNVVPEAGDFATLFEVDTNGVTQGNAGANQTWDFSGMEPLPGFAGTKYTYLAPSSTPPQYAAQFPAANLATRIGEGDTAVYSYIKKETNQFAFLGAISEDFIQEYPNTDIQFKSLSYNGTFSDDFTNTTDAGTGFVFYGKGSRTTTYDAYGTLKTPVGTFQNAMRTKTVSSQVDSVDFGVGQILNYTTLTVYNWFVANQPGVLVSVYYTRIISENRFPGLDTLITDTGVFKSAHFYDDISVGTFNQPDELAGVSVSFAGANPAYDQLSLKIVSENNEQDLRLLLTNVEGKVAGTQSLTLTAGENQVSLPVSHLASGSYFLTLTDGKSVRTLNWQKL